MSQSIPFAQYECHSEVTSAQLRISRRSQDLADSQHLAPFHKDSSCHWHVGNRLANPLDTCGQNLLPGEVPRVLTLARVHIVSELYLHRQQARVRGTGTVVAEQKALDRNGKALDTSWTMVIDLSRDVWAVLDSERCSRGSQCLGEDDP